MIRFSGSFTILVIVLIISESLVSGFTINRSRTTTLRSVLDLTAEESALLEVKSDSSKLNNERDNIKNGRQKLTIRKSVNFLAPDKKINLNSRKNMPSANTVNDTTIRDATTKSTNENSTVTVADITTSVPKIYSNNKEKTFEHRKSANENATVIVTETTKSVPDTESSKKETAHEPTSSTNKKSLTVAETNISVPGTDTTKKDMIPILHEVSHYQNEMTIIGLTSTKLDNNSSTYVSKEQKEDSPNQTQKGINVNDLHNLSTFTENVVSTPFVTEETKTTGTEMTSTESTDNNNITTMITENYYDSTKYDSTTSEAAHVELTSSQDDGTTSKSETLKSTGTKVTGTTTEPTESMVQPSKVSTKNPKWKKYTVIERKRIITTTEPEGTSTEKLEELEKAESISSRVTLDNFVSATPIQSLEELRQEFISDAKGTTMKDQEGDKDMYLTTQTAANVLEPENKQLPLTPSIDTTTETKADFVASKRAGYLDLSEKQTTTTSDDVNITGIDDIIISNETELLGSLYEIETQEDSPEVKNSSIAESQSQLADDAIKEELLKEETLNDHAENSKRYEDQQDLNKVKPLDTVETTDESLSVKPIGHGKGSLYTVSSNYRKMKKIEVQASKPFVRDPDDNSWRNESLTSLGIVFKAKNASKPFTQVLKNKTEAELNNIYQADKDNNNEVPDLRQRLEKIRKSRRKKVDKFGDTIYGDYEETSGESASTPKTNPVSIPIMEVDGEVFFKSPTPASPLTEATQRTTTPGVYMYKEETTTKKPKKINKFPEYYDTTDEYDAEYINLSKIDLKKFTTRLFAKDDKPFTPSPMFTPFTQPMQVARLQDRKPTVQYFPPRQPSREQPQGEQPARAKPQEKQEKVNINDYDSDFKAKVNMFADKIPNDAAPITYGTPPPLTTIKQTMQHDDRHPAIPAYPASQYKPANLDKNVYVTIPPRVVDHGNKYPTNNDEGFNRASYVIKHYRDLINEAVKDDYDKSAEFMPAFTEAPLTGVTMNKEKDPMKLLGEDYDYDANFRKDILSRFVDNFNQNSERFKVDFPILYNNTVVHMKAQENGKVVASSSAFMTRLYGDAPPLKACDPHCDVKVELSPAYELHYYVPDQEEKEEVEIKPPPIQFSYRL